MASGVTPKRQAMARRSSARMVIIRPLKSWRCTWIMLRNRRSRSRSGPLTELSLVRSMVTFSWPSHGRSWRRARPGFSAGRCPLPLAVGTPPVGVVVLGQELVHRHVVELGQPLQPRHRDGALAAFVGTEDRCLELLVRHRLDGLKGEAHLLAHGPQARADRPGVCRPCGLLLLVLVGYHRLLTMTIESSLLAFVRC